MKHGQLVNNINNNGKITMDIINLIGKSSHHILAVDPGEGKEPESWGSGCIVKYKNRLFVLSVAHVTDIDGKIVCLETNQQTEGLQSKLYHVGSLCYFDTYKVPDNVHELEIKAFEDLNLTFDETLDITFCELKENIEFLQPEWDFGAYKVDAGVKVCLNLETAGEPNEKSQYGFCGRVRPEFNGVVSKTEVTIKLDLEYKGTHGRFHIFHAPETIKDENDYKGCSGAPVLEETGKLVGLASSIIPGTKTIFAFSIKECKRLLDIALGTGML